MTDYWDYIKREHGFILAFGDFEDDEYIPLSVYRIQFATKVINGKEKVVNQINEELQFVVKNFNGKCRVIDKSYGPVYKVYYTNEDDAKAAIEWLNEALVMYKISGK